MEKLATPRKRVKEQTEDFDSIRANGLCMTQALAVSTRRDEPQAEEHQPPVS